MKYFFSSLLVITLFFGSDVHKAFAIITGGAIDGGNPSPAIDGGNSDPAVDVVTGGGVSATGRLQNPLDPTGAGGGIISITGLLEAILDIIMILAVPVIVFFIIYAGFLYVTARGNSDKVKTANQTLLWVIVGALIILGAQAILSIVQGTIADF